jgi:hypothetical protein
MELATIVHSSFYVLYILLQVPTFSQRFSKPPGSFYALHRISHSKIPARKVSSFTSIYILYVVICLCKKPGSDRRRSGSVRVGSILNWLWSDRLGLGSGFGFDNHSEKIGLWFWRTICLASGFRMCTIWFWIVGKSLWKIGHGGDREFSPTWALIKLYDLYLNFFTAPQCGNFSNPNVSKTARKEA